MEHMNELEQIAVTPFIIKLRSSGVNTAQSPSSVPSFLFISLNFVVRHPYIPQSPPLIPSPLSLYQGSDDCGWT